MRKPRRTQKHRLSSQTIHPLFRLELISLLVTSTGRKRRFFLAGVIALLWTVSPAISLSRTSYAQTRTPSVRLVIRSRKKISGFRVSPAQFPLKSLLVLSDKFSVLPIRHVFTWAWHSLDAFMDLSHTTRGSPVSA